jgi:hypothetical protein
MVYRQKERVCSRRNGNKPSLLLIIKSGQLDPLTDHDVSTIKADCLFDS